MLTPIYKNGDAVAKGIKTLKTVESASKTMIMTPPVQRFAQLDTLRGVAVMIVVFYHIWLTTPYSIPYF